MVRPQGDKGHKLCHPLLSGSGGLCRCTALPAASWSRACSTFSLMDITHSDSEDFVSSAVFTIIFYLNLQRIRRFLLLILQWLLWKFKQLGTCRRFWDCRFNCFSEFSVMRYQLSSSLLNTATISSEEKAKLDLILVDNNSPKEIQLF